MHKHITMSYQLLKEDVLFYQRFLKSCGYYKDKLDGAWGKNTSKADAAFLADGERIKEELGTFDSRSEGNIITLMPRAQRATREMLTLAKENNKDVRLLSGTRTYDEQNALYRKGRFGNPGPRVTNAKGGQSNHNFGIAWDIGLFDKGKYITDDKPYKTLSNLFLNNILGLEWGGQWTTFPDYPHYQLQTLTGGSVASIRGLFEEGSTIV